MRLLPLLLLLACRNKTAAECDSATNCAPLDSDSPGDSSNPDDSDDTDDTDDTHTDSPVENTAPTGLVVAIDPLFPTEDDPLQCAVTTPATDAQGDDIAYSFAWTVDGVDFGITSELVDASLTTLGQAWTCSVTPSDGQVDGTSASATVTIAALSTCGTGEATSSSDVSYVELCPTTFSMGCTDGQSSCEDGEFPVHDVTLTHGYWMGQFEVTQGQYLTVMGENPTQNPTCGEDCPVDSVTWHMAAAYTNAVSSQEGLESCYACAGAGSEVTCVKAAEPYECSGYRLPTEAEWEAAARCGEDLLYAGSTDIDAVAWYESNSGGTPQPVGGLLPNPCGLYDMSGGAWEWTQDGYSTYPSEGTTDPTGDSASAYLIIRGGSWRDEAYWARIASRHNNLPSDVDATVGFRLVRTVE